MGQTTVRKALSLTQQGLRLLGWLGPWSSPDKGPRDVDVERVELQPHSLASKVYRPHARKPNGVYVVAPGLHYAGPDDPRLDRFCRILAHAGFVVVAPFLRAYRRLHVTPAAAQDLEVAVRHGIAIATTQQVAPPALFSISFGCIPSLITAAGPLRDDLSALFVFGGFADFNRVIRFAVNGRYWLPSGKRVALPHDPLNRPAVFINMLPYLVAQSDNCPLAEAWLEMAKRTWGRPAMRQDRNRRPVADLLAQSLDARWRELFLVGCGYAPGGTAIIEGCLDKGEQDFGFTDPRRFIPHIRCPVFVSHGRDDDVIPYVESETLSSLLAANEVEHQLMLTGLFSHTETALPDAAQLRRELATLKELLRALVMAPQPASLRTNQTL